MLVSPGQAAAAHLTTGCGRLPNAVLGRLSLASPFGNDACDEDFEMEQINRIINVDYNFDAPIWKRYSAASASHGRRRTVALGVGARRR